MYTIDYSAYQPGVTVIPCSESPTGYLAVFVFDEKSLTENYLAYYKSFYQADLTERLDLNNIARVQFYSNTALLFTYDEQKKHQILDPRKNAHAPDAFADGMYPAGGDTSRELYDGKKVNYDAECVRFGDGLWGTVMPLLSGCTDYNLRLIDAEGHTDGTYLFDPANPPMQNTVSGLYSRSSVVYVPYDPKTPAYTDRTVENPCTGEKGTLLFAAYDGADGTRRDLGIYLPKGYDAARKEKYRTVYISHGMQSEKKACEMRWLHECALVNVMDNMGTDFVLVAMNNSDLNWDYGKIWAEQEKIIAYVESNFNVSSAQKDRAFCGFSMGGMTTSMMYMDHTDTFGYYGIWNAANHVYMQSLPEEKKQALKGKDVKVQIAYGDWDWCMPTLDAFSDSLKELGIEHELFTVPGSHDWRCFGLIFQRSAQSFLFK